MRCTSMDAEETDVVYQGRGEQSPQRSNLGTSNVRICVKLFPSVLSLLCLIQVSAQSQDKMLWQSTAPIAAVRFTPSGGVIGVSRDGNVTLLNSETGRPAWSISLSRAPRKNDYTHIKVSAMDLSPDGRLAVVAYVRSGVDRNLIDEKASDPTRQEDSVLETHIVLIDATDGRIKKDIEEFRGTSVNAVVFASSGKYVFVTTATSMARALLRHESPASTTHVLSIDTGQVLRSFQSQGWMVSVTLSPDDGRFAAAALQNVQGDTAFYELQVYDAGVGKLLHSSKFETTQSAAISFSLDGSLLAVSRPGRKGLQVDLVQSDGTGKLTHLIPAAESTEIRAVAFVGAQRRIVLAGGRLHLAGFDDIGTARFNDQGGGVFVVDQSTGQKLKAFTFPSFVTCVAVSRDGLKIAAGMYDGRIATMAVL